MVIYLLMAVLPRVCLTCNLIKGRTQIYLKINEWKMCRYTTVHSQNILHGFLFVCLMVGFWCLMPLSTISFTGRENQVTDKLYHIKLYTSPWMRIKLTISVVIGTDCIGSCKSNYHMNQATTAPILHGDAFYNIKRKIY
jgi:hypothetical protein